MELTDFDIRQSDEGVGMMVLECGCEYFEPKSKLTKEEATEILKKLRDEILKNQEKAKFLENLNKSGYLEMLEESDRTVIRLKKLDIVTKIGFAYLMCNRDHPETRDTLEKLGNELLNILEGKE